jgi:hypothetical protein
VKDILSLLEENKKQNEFKFSRGGSLEDICQLFEKENEKKDVEKKLVKKGSLEDIAGLCEESEASTHNIVHEGKVTSFLF